MRFFRVDRAHIAYLRFTLEACDGLATLTTLDAREGIVALSFPDCFSAEVSELVAAMGEEIGLRELPSPAINPFLTFQETQHDA